MTGVSRHGKMPHMPTKRPFREASSGATRDVNTDKLVYDKFQHPLVVKRFAEYMNANRKMQDGSTRAGDNWYKGFPRDWLIESMHRHYMDTWLHAKGFEAHANEDIESALCGILFNAQAMLLEVLLDRDVEELENW